MSLVRVAPLLALLVALLYCQPAAGHPYDPHEHQESPFFEGWFLRITPRNNGPTFAVGIGHLPQQSVRNPSAACFLLLNPPSDDAAAATANITNVSGETASKHLALQQQRTYTHYFSSLDVHPGKQQAGCIGCPAFVASGENAGGSCRLEVTGDLVILEAELPGAFKVRLLWLACCAQPLQLLPFGAWCEHAVTMRCRRPPVWVPASSQHLSYCGNHIMRLRFATVLELRGQLRLQFPERTAA
jgi:hypothetical protein